MDQARQEGGMDAQVTAVRDCMSQVNRKLKVPRVVFEGFQESVCRKLRRCVHRKQDFDRDVVEPVDRELAGRVAQLEQEASSLEARVSERRKRSSETNITSLETQWRARDSKLEIEHSVDVRVENDVNEESSNELGEESVARLKAVLNEHSTLIKELSSALPSCQARLESNISVYSDGSAFKEAPLDAVVAEVTKIKEGPAAEEEQVVIEKKSLPPNLVLAKNVARGMSNRYASGRDVGQWLAGAIAAGPRARPLEVKKVAAPPAKLDDTDPRTLLRQASAAVVVAESVRTEADIVDEQPKRSSESKSGSSLSRPFLVQTREQETLKAPKSSVKKPKRRKSGKTKRTPIKILSADSKANDQPHRSALKENSFIGNQSASSMHAV